MTSKGLRLELFLTRLERYSFKDEANTFFAVLNCKHNGHFVRLLLKNPQNTNPRSGLGNESYGWLRQNQLYVSSWKPENNLRGRRVIIFTSTIPKRITYRNPRFIYVYLSPKLQCPDSTRLRAHTYGWRMEAPNRYTPIRSQDPEVMYLKTDALNEFSDIALIVATNRFGVQLAATTQPNDLRVQDWPMMEDVEQMTKRIHGQSISVKVKKQRVYGVYSYVLNVDVVEERDTIEPESMETHSLGSLDV